MTAFNVKRSDAVAFNAEADGTPFRVPDGAMFDAADATQAGEGVTGSLAAQTATASGAIEIASAITGQGGAEPDDGSLAGAMDVTPVHDASGDLAAEAADVSGAIEILPGVVSGALGSENATMAGSIEVIRDFSNVPIGETVDVTWLIQDEFTVEYATMDEFTVEYATMDEFTVEYATMDEFTVVWR